MGFKPDIDDKLVSSSALTLLVWSSGCKNRPRNDLLCVEWDVKPYTLTHSLWADCLVPGITIMLVCIIF